MKFVHLVIRIFIHLASMIVFVLGKIGLTNAMLGSITNVGERLDLVRRLAQLIYLINRTLPSRGAKIPEIPRIKHPNLKRLRDGKQFSQQLVGWSGNRCETNERFRATV